MFFISFSIIFAVPASPNLMEITQPNGAKFKAYLKGDEYFSWWESEKGLALYRNLVSGYFEYAKISIIDEKEELVTTGVIFISGEEPAISNAESCIGCTYGICVLDVEKDVFTVRNPRQPIHHFIYSYH